MVASGNISTPHPKRPEPRARELYDNTVHGYADRKVKTKVTALPEHSTAEQEQRSINTKARVTAETLAIYRGYAKLRLENGAEPPRLSIQTVRVPLWALAGISQHNAALVFSQIVYYLHPDFRDKRGAHRPQPQRQLAGWWRAMTAAELAAMTGLSEEKTRKAITLLKKHRWVNCKVRKFAGLNSYHFWLGSEALAGVASAKQQAKTGQEERAIYVPLWTMQVTDGQTNAAILLGRLFWMLLSDNNLQRDGQPPLLEGLDPERWWLATSIGECAGRDNPDQGAESAPTLPPLMLSSHQIKYAATALSKARIIQMGYHDFGHGRRAAIRLDYDACCAAILDAAGWELPVDLAAAIGSQEESA